MNTALKKICVYFFLVTFSGHLWAGGGTLDDSEGEKHSANEAPLAVGKAARQLKRTALFCKAIRSVLQGIKAAGSRLCDDITELSKSLNCLCLEDDVLDEMGSLAMGLSSCSLLSGSDKASYDDPLDCINRQEPTLPRYDDLFPEAAIESALMEAYKKAIKWLTVGGYGDAALEDYLKRVLEQYPGHRGVTCHSTLLHEILRRLYIDKKKFAEALASLEFEFKSLPFSFIEGHDPDAIVEYAEVLYALGRTKEAFTFLSRCVTSATRPYIRRRAALWRARVYEEQGNIAEAESALIEALVIADQDPRAYLALINHYYANGNESLARVLTGVMKEFILRSSQWRSFPAEKLESYIHGQLPEPLRDYQYSGDDLMMAIKLWIGKGQLNETSEYWLPLIKNLSERGPLHLFYGDNKESLQTLLFDLVKQLSLSPDQQKEYYKALYRHSNKWICNGFCRDALADAILYALAEGFKNDDHTFELARYIVDKDRERGYFERQLANREALRLLVEGHHKRGNTEQAIDVFFELIQQYNTWDQRSESDTLKKLMPILAPLMSEEQAINALQSMFDNFKDVNHSIPDMIDALANCFWYRLYCFNDKGRTSS